MGFPLRSRVRAAAFSLALLTITSALAGCANNGPRPLYYWGDYQPRLYEHLQGKAGGPQAELARLTETEEKARSENAALPPGFNAHLGLLYLQAGQDEKARNAFLTEEAQFPEARTYMDFLMRSKSPTPGTTLEIPLKPVVPAPVAPAPADAKPAASTAPPPAATSKPQ